LDSLYKLVGEILYFEKEKGNITSQLSIEKLTYFTVNNLIVLCKDKTLSFEETYSLIKFN
ncbi:TetR/AcrR family transcriptional regulator, partial [Clostridium chauvoei]|nr:TetR/AcrR family transcriptional regulator [Clostridium chauvoei]